MVAVSISREQRSLASPPLPPPGLPRNGGLGIAPFLCTSCKTMTMSFKILDSRCPHQGFVEQGSFA
jgi:hypothetical protein